MNVGLLMICAGVLGLAWILVVGPRRSGAREVPQVIAPAPPPPGTVPRVLVLVGGGDALPAQRVGPTEAEIRRAGSGDATWLELAPRGAPAHVPSAVRSPRVALADGTLAQTADATRAHALLCERLLGEGWEVCGRGDAWYAHRFRRAGATAEAA